MIKIWDLNKKYAYKYYGFTDQWADKNNWSEVPDNTINYSFVGDCALEGENFWISLGSNFEDAVFLYAKTDTNGTPSRHNEIYRVYDTPNGCRNYSGGSLEHRIIKNTPEEKIIESVGGLNSGCGYDTYVTTQYRLLNGKKWFQIIPISQADEQGFHGESRINIIPKINNDQDYVADSLKLALSGQADQISFPSGSKMMLDFVMDADVIWLMTWDNPAVARPFTVSQLGGATSGWNNIFGEIYAASRVWSSPFAYFSGKPITVGVINDIPQFRHSFWNYQPVYQYVNQGTKLTNWTVNYKLSPNYGKVWLPGYSGIWRIVGCVDGLYYTQETTVSDTTKSLEFTVPVSGYLEYVIAYLYGRNENTSQEVSIPEDIYKEAIPQSPPTSQDSMQITAQSNVIVAGIIAVSVVAGLWYWSKKRI